MVLLHGIGMDWHVWQAVARRFVPRFRLYIPDLRGHGGSSKPVGGYSLGHYAADIEQFMDAMDLKGVILIGSSLGGMIAAVLEETVDVVSARVLVDPPLRRGSGPKRPLFEDILRIKQAGVSETEQCQAIYRALQGESEGAGGTFVRYMAESWTRCAPGVLAEALHPVETAEQIDAALIAIESPVLLMRGNQDRGSVLPPEVAARALNLLRFGRERYFPASGHAIHGSEPARFVTEVEEFMRHATMEEVA